MFVDRTCRHRTFLLGVTLLAVASLPLVLQAAESPTEALAAALQPFIDEQEISGAVALVYQGPADRSAASTDVTYQTAVGMADLELDAPMKQDTASMVPRVPKTTRNGPVRANAARTAAATSNPLSGAILAATNAPAR